MMPEPAEPARDARRAFIAHQFGRLSRLLHAAMAVTSAQAGPAPGLVYDGLTEIAAALRGLRFTIEAMCAVRDEGYDEGYDQGWDAGRAALLAEQAAALALRVPRRRTPLHGLPVPGRAQAAAAAMAAVGRGYGKGALTAMRTRIPAALAAAAVTAVLAACGSAASTPAAAPPASTAAQSAAARPVPAASAACTARKPAGDLYVRTTQPGLQAQAQEIGGEWNWDAVTGTCQSSLAFTIATAGQASGECTTVGTVADNPGYDASAVPAAPLADVAGSAGPGC